MLASRPEFDDLMDGLSFDVISGVSYACFDTLIRHWDLLTCGVQGVSPAPLGVADLAGRLHQAADHGHGHGIACAEFSGLGRGYDGFTPRYFRGVVEAILANSAYQAGRLPGPAPLGSATLGLILSRSGGGRSSWPS